jgi:hypothetical protein
MHFKTGPIFKVRARDERDGYVIDATWLDGKVEQLLGVFVDQKAALKWIKGAVTSGPQITAHNHVF